jgi:alpha-tubulin suppressor-like RCC1 family protein
VQDISASAETSNNQMVTAHGDYSTALKDGQVTLWGENRLGMLGIGDRSGNKEISPVINDNIHEEVISLDAGYNYLLYLLSNGQVYVSGISSNIPVPVPGLNDVVDISSGSYESLALKRDGMV